MGRQKLQTPLRFCENCGVQLTRRPLKSGYEEPLYFFNQRKYCSIKCSSEAQRQKKLSLPPPTDKTGRLRARKMIPNCPCQICGKTGYTEVHHKDENPKNNDPSNLIRLCKSCHAKQHRHRNLCIICGNPVKGQNLCSKHWQAWKKSLKRGWDTEYTKMIKIALENQAAQNMKEATEEQDQES